ncbi:MAG: acyl--CoA ligase [bacterium]|nr:acyl--CoA ligase [bacterium]MCP5070145.1 acyl--CoA ligase [bacterium]
MTESILDAIRARAAECPEAPAWIADRGHGESETGCYAELLQRVDAAAAGCVRAGLAPGERWGLLAPQGEGFIEQALAILAAGACLVPIPDDTVGPALEAFAERARLHGLVRLGKDGHLEVSARQAPGSLDGQGDEAFRELHPAYLRFTSGTTHRRKGVILGHARILERLAAANRGLGIEPGDRILWLLPMAHHFVVSILLYLRFGATILLPKSSLARDVLGFAGRERATLFYASPYHYNLMAKDAGEQQLPDVRLAISTAEGLRPEIAERFLARFGLPLRQALGIIEVGLPVIDLADPRPGALGQPLPDYDVWLRTDEGRALTDSSSERTGEICIRGPGLFDAYLDPWTPSAEVLEPDGFRTGDQGFFDRDGRLHLAGRRANRINMAGMKFFSEEVEAVLDQLPGVRRSRVSARAHPHLGEIPVAELELEEGADAPDRKTMMTHCRLQLAAYKVPRQLEIVDVLPMTATGKLERTPGLEGER